MDKSWSSLEVVFLSNLFQSHRHLILLINHEQYQRTDCVGSLLPLSELIPQLKLSGFCSSKRFHREIGSPIRRGHGKTDYKILVEVNLSRHSSRAHHRCHSEIFIKLITSRDLRRRQPLHVIPDEIMLRRRIGNRHIDIPYRSLASLPGSSSSNYKTQSKNDKGKQSRSDGVDQQISIFSITREISCQTYQQQHSHKKESIHA